MAFRAYGVTVFAAAAVIWATSGTQREKPVLAATHTEALAALEADVVAHPGRPDTSRALAQAYLEAHQPGLAVALIEGADPQVRGAVRVRHVYARALVDEGRNDDALSVEDSVVTSCRPLVDGQAAADGCDATLFASAVHRAEILRELVSLGVTDDQAHPDVTLLAYQNASRQARIAVQ